MSKILMWVLVAGVVIGGYVVINNSKSEVTENDSNLAGGTELEGSSEANSMDAAGKKMAFSQFVKQGGSYKCEVKQYLSDFENSGTVYLNGGNMRGEFSTVAEGRTMDTSFIFKDEYMYSWSSSLPNMGFKMKVNPMMTNTNTEAETSGTYSWNADQIGDYNCEVWTVDPSKFALPAGVNFQAVGNKQ